MKALNGLDQLDQLAMMDAFAHLTAESLKNLDGSRLGTVSQKGQRMYRLRAKDYRIYFEVTGSILFARYILAPHSLKDFLVRSHLPLNEDFLEEEEPSFWNYLESLRKE
ncbi:MAG TPA: cytotoxic translational repressor of toxin-antitoxin stability system [Opitutae bacterium]|nr:cytotoxic translational repressor of toxin-antitoxin stability system [Opitutae bacterium]